MTDEPTRPTRHEALQAWGLAALCALLFVGAALLPGRAMVPYAPEVPEPMRTMALADGATVAELERGNTSMGDKYHQSLAWDRIIQDRFRAGDFPLWTRDIGGGAPFVPQMGQVYQPWNVLLFFWPSEQWYGPVVFLHLLLIGWFAYAFFRRLGCVHKAALFGLVCAVLGLWMQGRVHQNVVLSAALPLFAALSAVLDVYADRCWKRRLWSAGVLGLAVGISWLGGFAPVSLQLSYLVVAFALLLAWTRRDGRALLWVGAGLGLAGLVALGQMLPTLLAAAETSRLTPSVEVLAANAMAWPHLLGLWLPDLFVWPDPGAIDRVSIAALSVFDQQTLGTLSFTETAFSLGLPATVAAAGLCAARRGVTLGPLAEGRARERRRIVGLFVLVAVAGFWFATATWPVPALSGIVPGARAGDLRRFLFAAFVGATVLGALGADRLLRDGTRRIAPALVALIGVIGGAWVLVSVSGSLAEVEQVFVDWLLAGYGDEPGITADVIRGSFAPGEVAANASHLWWTGARALVIGGTLAVLQWRGRAVLGIALCAFAVFELVHAGYGNRIAVPAERVAEPPLILQPAHAATRAAHDAGRPRPRLASLARPTDTPPRGLLGPNLPAFWGLEHLSAYNPLPKRRMEEFFLALEPRGGAPWVLNGIGGSGVGAFRDPATLAHPMLDVLGVEWVLASVPAGDLPTQSAQLEARTPAGVPAPYGLYARGGALPRATFVDTAIVEVDKAVRLGRLGDPARDPRREVLLEDASAPAAHGDGFGDAEIECLLHADDEVVLRVTCTEPGYVRLADPYDAGWTATVDGESTRVFVADHYLRAVFIEPGTHDVVFRFDGFARVLLPHWLTLLGFGLGLGALVAGRRTSTRNFAL